MEHEVPAYIIYARNDNAVSNCNAKNREYTLRYLTRRSYRLLKQLEFYEASELKDIQAAQYLACTYATSQRLV